MDPQDQQQPERQKPILRTKVAYEDLRLELKKVEWPERKHVAKITQMVFLIMIAAMVVVGVLDFGFTKVIQGLATR